MKILAQIIASETAGAIDGKPFDGWRLVSPVSHLQRAASGDCFAFG